MRMMRNNAFLLLLNSFLFFVFASSACADYAIRDGDTVVFLGDSITAARTYGRIIEHYTLMRYPERKVKYINAGWGGDTAAGGMARLERDVFSKGATILTVAYGINDIGWGINADEEHKQIYLDSIRGIVHECKKRKVRVFICSAAITASDPYQSENDFLQKMCDEGMAISRSLGEAAIDVQRTMRKIYKRMWDANKDIEDSRKKHSLHAEDGIHLNDLGQTAMAFAILKGLGAPAKVSSAEIDTKNLKVLETSGCSITILARKGENIEFVRLDEGLPINFGPLGTLNFWFIPIPDELNRYMLIIKNLTEREYEIEVNGRNLGSFKKEALEKGLNISSVTPDPWQPGGPWDVQATLVRYITESRDKLAFTKQRFDDYLKDNPNKPKALKATGEIETRLQELQHIVAQPIPYHFKIKPKKHE